MKHRATLMLVASGLILYSGTTAASAATTPSSSSVHQRFCTVRAVPAGSSKVPVITCYHTFADSIRAATHGRVRLPESTRSGSLTPDELNSRADTPGSTSILGIDYMDGGFGGSALSITQSAKCGSYQMANMPGGWNDDISSAQTSSGCASTLYQNANYSGSTLHIAKNSGNNSFGSFNDQASSQKFCATAPCS